MDKKNIDYKVKSVVKYLLMAFGVLFVLNMISVFSVYFQGFIIKKIDFNHEMNIPTYYSTLQLFLAAYLVWWVSVKKMITKDKFRIHWRGLSFILFFLALDEGFRIHDKIGVENSGGWVKYYLLLSFIVGVSYLMFLFKLPKRTRNLMVLSGGMFVTGALAFEVFGVYLKKIGYGSLHVYYRLSTTTEESLELLAIVLFIYTMLDYIVNTYGEFFKEFKKFNLRVVK